jgi:hypothetical protein
MRRPYQNEPLRVFAKGVPRQFAKLWERQAGKSRGFADIALLYMMKKAGRTAIYGSASLLLGQELPVKLALRADETAREMIARDSAVIAGRMAQLNDPNFRLTTADSHTGQEVKDLTADDIADLFEQSKLEFRVYHDRGAFSRMRVIAPNIATARGWSGLVILDEIAFIRALKELITALLPIISTQKAFRILYGTTPPEYDDTHYSFEMLAPPPDLKFVPNPIGNWYESQAGIMVHRVDAYDSHLAGKKIFDLTSGKELSPDEAYAKALNKDGHKIAHFLAWIAGGAAACDMLRLTTAQERGAQEGCQTWEIDTDADFLKFTNWLAEAVDPIAKVGLGFDVATTTGKKSNPSVLAVAEEHGPDIVIRAFAIWKTRDPDVARERLQAVFRIIAARPGGRAKAIAIDATSEKLFAEDCRKDYRSQLPVILVVASEGVEKASLDKPINFKEFTGQNYVAKLDDNNLTLPPGTYVRIDHRLVLRDRGKFVCEPDDQGRHGDTFDGGKLALHALSAPGGGVARPELVRTFAAADVHGDEAIYA